MLKRFTFILGAAILATAPALADQWNKKTILTFSQPVEIPGTVLPAGQYVFKLVDSNADRHIVQVFNAAEDKVYATILALPHYRMEPTDGTVILFEERRADQPQAIHAWFYPGETYGQEFVYPKDRALELARETHKPVLTGEVTPTETPAELEKTPVTEMTPENKEVEVPAITEPPPAPAPAPAPAAEPLAPPAPVASVPEPELPRTASQIPLLALLGGFAFGLAGLLKLVEKRTS